MTDDVHIKSKASHQKREEGGSWEVVSELRPGWNVVFVSRRGMTAINGVD